MILKIILLAIFLTGCSSMQFEKTVDYVDLTRFGGDWYVQAARPTIFESEVHNGIEHYDIEGDKIKIKFTYKKGSFKGPEKKVEQKGSVHNHTTNAHWKVSPFWPLKFDFLVIALAKDYSWTAVGVPSGKYLWVMSREFDISREEVDKMIQEVKATGYPVHNIEYIPHNYTDK